MNIDIPDYTLNERKIGIAICELAGHFITQSNFICLTFFYFL